MLSAMVAQLYVLVNDVTLVVCRKAFFPKQKEEEQGENSANAVIRREYAKLGPITSVLRLFDCIMYRQRLPNICKMRGR